MSTGRDANVIIVHSLGASATRGRLLYGPLNYPCALGRSGRQTSHREGNGASPIGLWALRRVCYRRDKLLRPRTVLPISSIKPHDGWCDAPADRNYNRPVSHPYAASAEELWRSDDLYDLVVELGYNDRPRVKGLGSAIFMHVASDGYQPTEGCIALRKTHLLQLLAQLRPGIRLLISA